MRCLPLVLGLLLCPVSSLATTRVSVGVSLPGLSIGINLPAYPRLVAVPGYPVYYAPQLAANYFFYDGMYWVYADDSWYSSYWYNGPWDVVYPEYVPLFILRVPVYYYRRPPVYFREWRRDAPPRWGQHWGRDWERDRRGWDHWNRRAAPAPAPLPSYQREYSGDRYPDGKRQSELQKQHYRYEPRDRALPSPVRAHELPWSLPPRPQRDDAHGSRQDREMNVPDWKGQQHPQAEAQRPHDDGRGQKVPGPGRGQRQDPEDRGHGRDR